MADQARFGRLRLPVITLYIHTEHSVFKVSNAGENNATQANADQNAFNSDIISFKTTNNMSDDSATFSVVLPLRRNNGVRWDNVISENDVIVIRIDSNEDLLNKGVTATVNNNIMTGIVSEVAIDGEYSSDSEMVQVTGQSFSKVFSQFRIGMISEVEQQLSGMGWLWDSSISPDAYTGSGDSDDSGGSGASVGDFDAGSGSTSEQLKALCKQIGSKTGIKWEFILAQVGVEVGSLDGNSYAAKNDNNFSGIKYANQEGATSGSNATDGAGGAYAHFKSKAYWALAMSNTLAKDDKSTGNALSSAKTVYDFAKGLKAAHYFEADVGQYAAGLNTWYKQITGQSSSTSGSTSGSSSTSSGSSDDGDGTTTDAAIAAEKAASPNGGVAFYDNNVAGIESALIERFKPYIILNYDNNGYTIWSFLDYSNMTSWDTYEKLKDSSNFVNFSGTLYELMQAAQRQPFNEMFFDSTSDGISKFTVRRTPFNPEDWYNLQQVTIGNDAIITKQVSRSAREQYSVFVDNPASGLLSIGVDSLAFGSFPKTNLDLIKVYGYAKMEVSDLYVTGADDKDYSINGGDIKKAKSTNNEKGTMYDYAKTVGFLSTVTSKTNLTQKPLTYSQELANKANNISMFQASRLVNAYISNAYNLTEAVYNDIMNTDQGGGQANTGTHKLSYAGVSKFIKGSNNLSDFITKSKPYFKNVSDEELTAIYNASESGKIDKKAYDTAVKSYDKDETGEKSTGDLLDTDFFQTTLYNWYANNVNFLSGTITILGDPDIRIGTILNDAYDHIRYYIESVSHTFSFTEGFQTEIGVTRGLKYQDGQSDPRFTATYMWGTGIDYKGGYMGEAPVNYLAIDGSSSGDDSSDGSGAFSGAAGPESAVKAAKFGATFEKTRYTSKSEVYALGGYGERGSTNPLTNDINNGKIILDCSSFIYWCFKKVGVTTGNTTWAIRDSGMFDVINVSRSSLDGMKIGDIVFLYNCGHVMFYVGSNKLMGWNGGGNNNASWDPSGGCAIVSLSDMGGVHDGAAYRLKG